MPEQLPDGIDIRSERDLITIAVGDASWEGSPAQAERVLTGLHYAIARARPGVNIGSMLINGALWGGKFVEPDPVQAIERMRILLAGLTEHLDVLEERSAQRAP